jgi:hypothetical protein
MKKNRHKINPFFSQGEKFMWQIPPYFTKDVMRANFLARAESNYTAYIRYR